MADGPATTGPPARWSYPGVVVAMVETGAMPQIEAMPARLAAVYRQAAATESINRGRGVVSLS
ncbi:hypothetical protein Q3V37_25600 [Micromonospora profundi]|uniref:Uncharacterized protein n=1 Tax=Micromonospora profundi TaxID=1420889 RepID=A0AAJ6L4M1_9ACTN|nr:hypothetical protein [Micromonospora profundi]WLS44728.1 hypothetical protein Q3V37_25600 [Micromonospora profundi]